MLVPLSVHRSLVRLVTAPHFLPWSGRDALHTSLAIDTQSLFVAYQHNSATPSNITFNLKDFRCGFAAG